MQYKNATVIPSSQDYNNLVADITTENILKHDRNAKKEHIIGPLFNISVFVLFVSLIFFISSIKQGGPKLYISLTLCIISLIILGVTFLSRERDTNPSSCIQLSYLLFTQKYNIERLWLLSENNGNGDIRLIISNPDHVIEQFDINDISIFRKTEIDGPLLDLNANAVYFPFA